MDSEELAGMASQAKRGRIWWGTSCGSAMELIRKGKRMGVSMKYKHCFSLFAVSKPLKIFTIFFVNTMLKNFEDLLNFIHIECWMFSSNFLIYNKRHGHSYILQFKNIVPS